MPFTPHAVARAAETVLKTADAGHTSGAVLIFLRVVDAGARVEFAMGVLSLLAMLMLLSDAVRFMHAFARAGRRPVADDGVAQPGVTPERPPVAPEA